MLQVRLGGLWSLGHKFKFILSILLEIINVLYQHIFELLNINQLQTGVTAVSILHIIIVGIYICVYLYL